MSSQTATLIDFLVFLWGATAIGLSFLAIYFYGEWKREEGARKIFVSALNEKAGQLRQAQDRIAELESVQMTTRSCS